MARPGPGPFVRRDGALYCEDVALADLAVAREGRPAWVLSQRALELAFAGNGGPVTAAVGAVGPPEVLALAARHDHWVAVCSSHELTLATDAGFGPERMVATGRVRDDGFLKDALLAGVAVVSVADDGDNLARLADALGVELPPATGAPAPAIEGWLGATGGLFSAVLAPPPDLRLDASFRPRVGEQSVLCLDDGPQLAGTLSGLSSHGSDEAQLATIDGTVARGGWVVVPRADAVAVHVGDGAHPEPTTVLVRDGLWRELSPRPVPVDPGLEG